jgi:hypothetical protein
MTGITVTINKERPDLSFPRVYTDDEERKWVDEARRRTSPKENITRCCIVCGKLTEMESLLLVSEYELLRSRHLLHRHKCYKHVPDSHFQYRVGHSRLDGLVLDQEGFLKGNESEGMDGAATMAWMCTGCQSHLSKNKLPPEALANSLWTGAGMVKELSGLTWVEEKFISCVHVSVQVQKCRPVRNWKWDAFHPQPKVKGHIITYPADPAMVLRRLPLKPAGLVQLVKVVFMSNEKPSFQEASKSRFFLVRREKVRQALLWLKEHNPLYKDVELDYEALAQLPEEGIVPEIYNCMTFCNRIKEDLKAHSRYDAPDSSGAI